MSRILFYLIFLVLFHSSCVDNKPKALSETKPVFSIDASRPIIESGFYLISEEPENAIKRRLFSFKKNDAQDGNVYFLNPNQFISFVNIDSISWKEDPLFNTGSFMLNISLNLPGTYKLKNLSLNANDLRLKTTYGLRIGMVANNTLVIVATIAETIADGKMELSYIHSLEDAEKMKKFFDKAVAVSKANKEK